MLISYQWLKELISLPEPFETILAKLTNAGVAVEQVRPIGNSITGVIVAELLSVEKHPQADRLSLTQVSTGKETLQVVCGAKNIAPGQKVPLAKVGAVLPGNFEIKAAKIRGVDSQGMLCSSKELGLAEDAEGILILPPDASVGQDFVKYMGLPDTLFELEITPNRADLLSHFGLARELSTILGRPALFPKTSKFLESSTPTQKLVKVSVEAKDLCSLYSCRVIQNLQVGPSPQWLVQRLERLGQRSINNIVDVTNYILHELGQPLHAFDLSQIQGNKIVVRKATQGEKIPLLDKTVRELQADMLVIADHERPIALAGIMGGGNSEVTGQTKDILLEAALFLPGSVRKTAKRLAISTDSSYRFERGVDPLGVKAALDRAAALILKIAGGKMAKGIYAVETQKPKQAPVSFRPSRANSVLGLNLPSANQSKILKRLRATLKKGKKPGTLSVLPPSYRLDLVQEIDFIEEIARLSGYEHIPTTPPPVPISLVQMEKPVPLEAEVRSIFHQAGLYEALNTSFLPPTFADQLKLDLDHPFRQFSLLLNPIADDQKAMRPTLLPSLLSNVQMNLAHQQETVYLFEMNKVFHPNSNPRVTEKYQAAAVLAGKAEGTGWQSPERKVDFFDIKGLAENLIALCRLKNVQWIYGKNSLPYLRPESFQVQNQKGSIFLWGGGLHPKVLKNFDISAPCFTLELDFDALAETQTFHQTFSPLPRFPGAWRDIALVVADGVTSGEVQAAIEAQGGPSLQKVALFDLYRGPNVPAGSRSLAFRLRFQDPERTLTDAEVTERLSRIVDHLKTRYSIVLR